MSYLFLESPYFPGNVGGRWPEMTTHIPGPLVDLVASTEDTIKKGVATSSYVLVHIQFKKASRSSYYFSVRFQKSYLFIAVRC